MIMSEYNVLDILINKTRIALKIRVITLIHNIFIKFIDDAHVEAIIAFFLAGLDA